MTRYLPRKAGAIVFGIDSWLCTWWLRLPLTPEAKCNEKQSAITALDTFIWSVAMAIGIFGTSVAGGWLSPGAAQEAYPWCTQGSLLHCYYGTRDQCEQTVDYHGFCVPNPDVSPRNNQTVWRSSPPR